MRYQLTEQWPAVTDTFVVADEGGTPVYQAKARLLSLREQIDLRDAGGAVVAALSAQWPGRGFTVSVGGAEAATVHGGRRPAAELAGGGGKVTVKGRVGAREYTLLRGGKTFGEVSRRFFSLTEVYGLEVGEPGDTVLAISLVVALHRLCVDHD